MKPYNPKQCHLVVRRDFIGSNGRWRLAWTDEAEATYVDDESTVTGQPFFRTMRDAVAHGRAKYQETAVRVAW
jgi:hypothetical protein